MAIKLIQSSFTDIYGNVTNEFKANVGDLIKVEQTYATEISSMTTLQSRFRIDKIENKLSRTEGSFLADGFRIGQNYSFVVVDIVNNISDNYTGTILTVSDLSMTMTGLPNLNAEMGNDYIGIILCSETYDSLNFAFNFVDNDIPKETSPSLESLIDQETSRFNANGLTSMLVGDIIDLIQVGKQSGQFTVTSASVERLADVLNPYTAFNSVRRQYKVTLYVIFNGMFSPDSFKGVKCLKYYSKASFKVFATENLAPTVIEYNEKANTGLWNEGFNEDQANSTLTTTLDTINYNLTNTITVTAKCPTSLGITTVEIGGMYITIDEDFNKNKQQPQDYFLPFLKTGLIGVADIGNDWVSTSKPFNLMLDNFSYIDAGGDRYFTLTFTINPFYANPNGFGKFIEERGELDRRFLLWLKVGNTNLSLFDGELTYEQPVGLPFTPSTSNFINHDNNDDYKQISTVINNKSNDDFNKEDDIAHVSEFTLSKNDVNQSIIAKVVVKNTTDDFEFVLDKISFNLEGVDLKYFINQTISVNNNLPESSNKKFALLYEKTPLSGDEMEVRLYYPIIIDWRYWEEVFVTHPFFVSQNKNNSDWLNYKVSPWNVFVKIEIKRNDVFDYYYRPINFLDYDDWDGISTIELYDATETTQYQTLQENTTMLIKATHIFPSNYSSYPWGMITIEPKESSPRFILSTEIDRLQYENPLFGINNIKRCDIEYYSANTIILRCYVNTNSLTGNNFCISSKISEDGQPNNNPVDNKWTEDSQDKITEDETNIKITE